MHQFSSHLPLVLATTYFVVLSAAVKRNGLEPNSIEQNSLNQEETIAPRHRLRSIKDWIKVSLAPPTVVEIPLGGRMEIECEVYGSPAPTIGWLKGTTPLQNIDDFETNQIELGLPRPSNGRAKTRSRLIIDCVLPQHEGLYSCLATAGTETLLTTPTMVMVTGDTINNLTAMLTACSGSNNPLTAKRDARIVQWSPIFMELEGNDVVLPCRAEGNPRPVTYWMDSSNEVVRDDTPRYKVLPSGDLMIYKIRWSDMGGLTCVATNNHARDTTSTFLYPVAQ